MILPARHAELPLAALRRLRRTTALASPRAFAEVYLAQAFGAEPAPFHVELFDEVERATPAPGSGPGARCGARLAIAAPRGHAKSTILTRAFPLWALLSGRERYVLIVSATADQATRLLDHIKRQIETNDLIRADFPSLARRGPHAPAPWRKNALRIPLDSGDALVWAYGAGQRLRGARHGADRPGLIIADDLEDTASAQSEEQRGVLAAWFDGTLVKAGTPATNVLVVGTVLHQRSLLACLLDPGERPGWRGLVYRAIVREASDAPLWDRWASVYRGGLEHEGQRGPDAARRFYEAHRASMDEGAEALWPAVYPYATLMEISLREGRASFSAEYQNQPTDPQLCLFAERRLVFWDDRVEDIEQLRAALGSGTRWFAACDPSFGAGDSSDYSAIVVVAQRPDPLVRSVVVADIARRSPAQTIETLVAYVRSLTIEAVAVEANHFQRLMADQLSGRIRDEGLSCNVVPVTNSGSKLARIGALDVEIGLGRLEFSRSHHRLLEQLRGFPLARHDDGPDALEMAVRLADSRQCRVELYISVEEWPRERRY